MRKKSNKIESTTSISRREVKTETLTTIKIPNETLIKIKGLAVEKSTTQTDIILQFINKGLDKTEKEHNELPKARVINSEMPGYDPDKKFNSIDLIGIVEVDNPEKIDVQELKDSIHFKKELY